MSEPQGFSSDKIVREHSAGFAEKAAAIFEFGDLQLDIGERVLLRLTSGERISLPDKAFDTLCYLVRNAGRLVGKDELLNAVWPDSFVEENNLNKSIFAIRRALGDKNGDKRYIETVKKHGYRFVAEVQRKEPSQARAEDANGQLHPKKAGTVRAFPHLVSRSDPPGAPALAAESAPTVQNIPAEPSVEPILREVHASAAVPTQRRNGPSRIMAGAAVLLTVLVVTGSVIYRYASSAKPAGQSSTTMAVLPLKPVNAESRDHGIELAIADSLILKLNDAKVFQVSHLSAVRKFAEIDADPVESGRQLGVDYVLASNYQTMDGRIRVTSQLVNIGTGTTEKTFKCDTNGGNIFAMQDAVANDIGNAVLANFGRPATTYASNSGTQNEEAVNLFYEASYLIDKNTKDDSAKAADLLGQAVLLDPNYSEAWALRAQAYCQFAHRGGGAPDQLFTIAEPMLDKALMLNRDDATALLVKGVIDRDYHWRFDEAYVDFQRSIKADPDNWFAHRELAALYHHDGRFEDAIVEIKRTLELNPTNIASRWLLGLFQIEAGRSDEGVSELKRVIEMDPTFTAPYNTLWELYAREGDGRNAYSYFMKAGEFSGTKPEAMARFKSAYSKGGWPAVLRAEFEQVRAADLKDGYSGTKYYIAELAAMNGDRDTAIEYLEQALKYHLIGVSWIKVDRRLDPVRDDPRFQDILRRTGLSAG